MPRAAQRRPHVYAVLNASDLAVGPFPVLCVDMTLFFSVHLCALQAVGFEKNDAEGKLVLEGDSALPLLAATAAKLAKVRMALPACLVLCMVADANPPSVSLCFALSLSLVYVDAG